MTDKPFGRQPKPVSVVIDSTDRIDTENAANQIQAFLENRYASTTRYWTGNSIIIRAYPFAVND